MEQKLKLLFIDLTVSEENAEPDLLLHDYFEIAACGRDSHIAQQLEQHDPDVICFDFDYPDRAGLRMVEEIKRLFPSIPMFVATIQHSEELAVWAFRSRMTDFLVKPIPEEDLMRCYSVFQDICSARGRQAGRPMAAPEQLLPASAVTASKSAQSSLQPALYYVEKNIRKKLKADDVAKLCGMSSFRFSRLFKETFGIAFRDYVVRYRLREAYRMLQTGYTSVTEACFSVGFNDVAYFSRMFKRHFDVCPSTLMSEDADLDSSPTVTLQLPLH
jgi:YesN/AraC family two-component response regulator